MVQRGSTIASVTTRLPDRGGFGEAAGYSRAVRVRDLVAVSATAALADGNVLHPGDAYAQTRHALEVALAAAAELGAGADRVVRTRLLLAPGCDWRAAVRAHAELFADNPPANTTYFVGALIPEGALVEVELDALA
jgi:enamine deaminase RidA (YjgF/YER057c/UK114 family)